MQNVDKRRIQSGGDIIGGQKVGKHWSFVSSLMTHLEQSNIPSLGFPSEGLENLDLIIWKITLFTTNYVKGYE